MDPGGVGRRGEVVQFLVELLEVQRCVQESVTVLQPHMVVPIARIMRQSLGHAMMFIALVSKLMTLYM